MLDDDVGVSSVQFNCSQEVNSGQGFDSGFCFRRCLTAEMNLPCLPLILGNRVLGFDGSGEGLFELSEVNCSIMENCSPIIVSRVLRNLWLIIL